MTWAGIFFILFAIAGGELYGVWGGMTANERFAYAGTLDGRVIRCRWCRCRFHSADNVRYCTQACRNAAYPHHSHIVESDKAPSGVTDGHIAHPDWNHKRKELL